MHYHQQWWLVTVCSYFMLLLLSISFAEQCHPDDERALLNIKRGFNNPDAFSLWSPNTECCSWYAVGCHDVSNRVISLVVIADDQFPGPIPPSIGDLPHLQTLSFHKLPNLSGPIQPAIAKLRNLKFLDISSANLSGPIPDIFATLSALTYIRFSFNNLTGPIPASLASLPHLTSLMLDRNKLTGPIPGSFGSFKAKDFYLYLSHNQLSGRIPPSLSRVNFGAVDLSRNRLEGDASVFFGAGKKAWTVDLSRNLLEFNMSKIVFSNALFRLDVNHNKIFGGLPPRMTKLTSLYFLNVSYNRLCGPIPKGGALQALDVYSYLHNKCLCGAPLKSC